MRQISAFILLVIMGTACSTTVTIPPITETSPATPTGELAPPPISIIAPTLAPHPSATPDQRLPPEQWQKWPVVPSVTGKAIEIYKIGLGLGNNPHAFSKSGDCQSIKAAFMGYFDLPDRYNLGTDYQYLQVTINNFSGYFNTDGQAVKGGFNAATVLSPLWANAETCQPGENPLECELRITKPIIVFISFEVWWEDRTPQIYEKYMRQVIELVMGHGAVPILATKADNIEGDQTINLTTARLAYEYDLPLWNFWLSVQSLPDHGMDPIRNDGFHISTDGWNVRSFTGLLALDNIWRGLRDSGSKVTVLPTGTREPTQSSNLLPVPADGPSLKTSTEPIVFNIMSRRNGTYESNGVYLFDIATLKSVQILGSGFKYQSSSPDGKYLLVNQGGLLYKTEGTTLTLLTDRFFDLGETDAIWLPGGSIALILKNDRDTSLAIMAPDGTQFTPVITDAMPIMIYPSTNGMNLAWESGKCTSTNQCTQDGAWITNISTGTSQLLNGIFRPLISPDGKVMAYVYPPDVDTSNLAFSFTGGSSQRKYPLPGDILADMAWQPGGSWLAVQMDKRSDYSGRVTGSNFFLVNAANLSIRQLTADELVNPRIVWSPDGRTLLWLGTVWENNSYSIHFWKVDVASGQGQELTGAFLPAESDYLFVNNARWLARP
jgi:hypothetical protein